MNGPYSGFETITEALDAHRAWLRGETGDHARRAHLSHADLRGAHLRHADLNGANLRHADLNGANLNGADLRHANLRHADLSHADLNGADLNGANLRHADLNGANLNGANLNGAHLSHADLRGANLSDADLSGAMKWEQYIAEVVPALCTAGGKTLEEVAAAWDCHDWTNCPMAIAFGVHDLKDVPILYRREAEFFVMLFDAKAIPNPIATVAA